MTRLNVIRTAMFVALLALASPVRADVTTAEAAPFLGDWTLTLQGANGPAAFTLSIKVEQDKVVGQIVNDTVGTQKITAISKSTNSLVLTYSFPYNGNPVDAVVTLTPAADGKIGAQIAFADGAYVVTGPAVKKEAAK